MIDEGYIKYNARRSEGDIPETEFLRDMNMVRTTLWNMRLIGVYPNGIGYGNISHRHKESQFIISGSATGESMILNHDQWALVEKYDLEQNSVYSIGHIDASSESMSHGAIYSAVPEVNVVIHVHDRHLFDAMSEHGFDHTAKEIPFGTPDLAVAIGELVKMQNSDRGVFYTAGHDEGIIAYGRNLDDAYEEIETIYNRFRERRV